MSVFPAPPIRTPFLDADGNMADPWTRWFISLAAKLSSTGSIAGSRGGNTAMASLISNLATKGIIQDNTTP